jgi:thiol-disulfide isomerase/thioredoxin
MAKSSVVTPERFVTGFTYQDYIAQVKVNKEQFETYYASGQLNPGDAEFFRKASRTPDGIGKILVLGEDWCPDVLRGLPVAARIAEAAGVELRVFPRDKNLDIMNEFLNHGEFMSIPVVVFYTKDLKQICHWIERPEIASRDQTQTQAQVKKEMPTATDQEFRNALRQRMMGKYPEWQKASVQEMRQMLAEKLALK